MPETLPLPLFRVRYYRADGLGLSYETRYFNAPDASLAEHVAREKLSKVGVEVSSFHSVDYWGEK